MTRRLSKIALAVMLFAAAAGAAVALNVLLLGKASASNDPVGRLTSRSHLAPAHTWVVRPTHGEVENDGADD